jgi:hypothetical protein
VALTLIALGAGCVTDQAVQQKETLLVEAGFKAFPAITSDQRWLIRTIPADKVSAVMRKGKLYFVYPDHVREMLYVGRDQEYVAYLRKAQAHGLEAGTWDSAWGDWDAP